MPIDIRHLFSNQPTQSITPTWALLADSQQPLVVHFGFLGAYFGQIWPTQSIKPTWALLADSQQPLVVHCSSICT